MGECTDETAATRGRIHAFGPRGETKTSRSEEDTRHEKI